MPHHRVELMERGNNRLDIGHGLALCVRQLLNILFVMGEELMERRVKEADTDRIALERLVERLKVALLIGKYLLERGLAVLGVVRADHLAEGGYPVGLKEHVLGAAEAYALGAQLAGFLGVARGVGIGAHLQPAVFVSPAHNSAELAGNFGVNRRNRAAVYVAGRAVKRDNIALGKSLSAERELFVFLVHVDFLAARHAALTHAARDNRRVGGHAASCREDALGGLHALDVLGRGFKPDKNNLAPGLLPLLGVFGGKDNLTACRARRGSEAAPYRRGGAERLGVKLRVEQGVKEARVYHQNRFLLAYHALVN